MRFAGRAIFWLVLAVFLLGCTEKLQGGGERVSGAKIVASCEKINDCDECVKSAVKTTLCNSLGCSSVNLSCEFWAVPTKYSNAQKEQMYRPVGCYIYSISRDEPEALKNNGEDYAKRVGEPITGFQQDEHGKNSCGLILPAGLEAECSLDDVKFTCVCNPADSTSPCEKNELVKNVCKQWKYSASRKSACSTAEQCEGVRNVMRVRGIKDLPEEVFRNCAFPAALPSPSPEKYVPPQLP